MVMQSRRILRDYRFWKCSKLHALSQKVRKSLTDNTNIPLSVWVNHPDLLAQFFAAADKLDIAYHESLLRSVVAIAARGAIEGEVIGYLDLIASLLEAAAAVNPDILLTSGFNLVKERRGRSRTKQPPAAELLNIKAANDDVATEGSSPT